MQPTRKTSGSSVFIFEISLRQMYNVLTCPNDILLVSYIRDLWHIANAVKSKFLKKFLNWCLLLIIQLDIDSYSE